MSEFLHWFLSAPYEVPLHCRSWQPALVTLRTSSRNERAQVTRMPRDELLAEFQERPEKSVTKPKPVHGPDKDVISDSVAMARRHILSHPFAVYGYVHIDPVDRYNGPETKSPARWPGPFDADFRHPHRSPFVALDAREQCSIPIFGLV